jgi:2-polyprenyl-6-methoxyphenol hydroxylase-like FAD-dependent oxidoreductase
MAVHDTPATSAAVAIVGAGPVGLALALGLARHDVGTLLIERKPATNKQSRAPALHVRTMEILRQWGVADALLAAGTLKRSLPMYHGPDSSEPLLTFDFGDLDDEADDAGVLFIEQGHTERLFLDAVRATGRCDVRFATEAVALEQDEAGVALTLRHDDVEQRVEANYVVGCDGTNSFVRDALGLPFDGFTYPLRATLADVRIDDPRDALPWPRFHNGKHGFTGAQRLAPQQWRIIRVEGGDPTPGEAVPPVELERRVAEVLGSGPIEVLWASRFAFQRRNSPRYRHGRVLLAGDAAHAFPPANGQGMNAGVQDAHNLAWKLAHALRGGNAERLLASYDQERRAIIGSVSRNVSLLTRVGIQAPRPVRAAVLQLMRAALSMRTARRQRARSMAMLDLDLPASALLDTRDRAAGRRLPNLKLRRSDGSQARLHDLLPYGSCLLDLSEADETPDDLPVDATLPLPMDAAGESDAPLGDLLGGRAGWILVRPDQHVALATSDARALASAARRALGW